MHVLLIMQLGIIQMYLLISSELTQQREQPKRYANAYVITMLNIYIALFRTQLKLDIHIK